MGCGRQPGVCASEVWRQYGTGCSHVKRLAAFARTGACVERDGHAVPHRRLHGGAKKRRLNGGSLFCVSVDRLLPVHQAQVLTYMGLTGCPAGLLINFNVAKLIDGVKRLIRPPASAR